MFLSVDVYIFWKCSDDNKYSVNIYIYLKCSDDRYQRKSWASDVGLARRSVLSPLHAKLKSQIYL